MSDKLYFQFYNPTGMINQVMSMELAVGLAHETKRDTILHYVSNSGDHLYNGEQVPIFTPSRWYNNQRKHLMRQDQFPHIKDILEWKDLPITLIDNKVDSFPDEHVVFDNILNNNYFSKENIVSEDELLFAEGRSRLSFDTDKNVHLKMTLGWYSRFFYKRNKDLDLTLSSVKFKPEYHEFADMVVKALGPFQAGHIRLSDHVKMFDTTQDMFESGLTRLEQNPYPIVISTCQPTHPMILANKHRFILLDDFIIDNFYKDFQQMPIQDEVIFGLICNIVMHHSLNFIGTSGSTYSGYIQRIRNQNNLNETWDFWDQPNAYYNGPYSWNDYDLHPGRKMWWREWSESKLCL